MRGSAPSFVAVAIVGVHNSGGGSISGGGGGGGGSVVERQCPGGGSGQRVGVGVSAKLPTWEAAFRPGWRGTRDGTSLLFFPPRAPRVDVLRCLLFVGGAHRRGGCLNRRNVFQQCNGRVVVLPGGHSAQYKSRHTIGGCGATRH